MEVYLVRHTETVAAKGICYGQSDVGIIEPIYEHVNAIVKLLPSVPLPIYSSPLARCVALAQAISNKFDTPSEIRFDNRIMELNFGQWELMLWDEIPMDELQPWMDDFVNARVPEGESFVDLHLRVGEFISLLKDYDNKSVPLIVTHAGVIRSFYAYFNKIDLKDVFDIDVPYGSVHHLSL